MKEMYIIKVVEITDDIECRVIVVNSKEDMMEWFNNYADTYKEMIEASDGDLTLDDETIELEVNYPYVQIVTADGDWTYTAELEQAYDAEGIRIL